MNDRLPDFRQMTRRETEDYLIERSLIDAGFRQRLKQAPRELLRELNIPVGPETRINIIEESPGVFHIVLPRPLDESAELSESSLDSVVGGTNPPPFSPPFPNGYV